MPKIVCENCQVEFRPFHNGTVVIEMASFGEYKAWMADSWRCPGCGAVIAAGFAEQPFAEHFEVGYTEMVEREKIASGHVVYDYECLGDVPNDAETSD